ncbi:MAG: beta-ketoacyl-ACP synthase II [Candidatus Latescibacteria bacterium]|nr:beta-ketoacyl-ACP synthase II [bacterium]MBD3424092.1 beta-ketoacyl-ACP synthase II [Candidatus Latescibacterota bacterium]
MSKRRVVVTGMGLISPCGKSVEESWNNIREGNSGIDLIKAFDVSEYRSQIGGEVKEFDPADYIDKKQAKRMDRYSQLGVAASRELAGMVGLEGMDNERVATIIGSGIGGISTFEKQHGRLVKMGPNKISPFFIPMMISDMVAGLISIEYGLKGPNYTSVSACASGGHAIASAFMSIKNGYADAAVTGGAEATISPMALGGFCSMKALSTRNDNPQAASRPFDRDRDGFIMAEGSGLIFLEELEHARLRGAEIYAELVGVGMTADAYHMTSPVPGGGGAVRSMKMALNDSGLEAGDIDYINAHGTSTPYNDPAESEAIRTVFGEEGRVLVSSTKSTTGHLLGAAAGLEAVVSVMALREGIVPPTINLENVDEKCRLNHVPEAREFDLNTVISNSFGFGGHNVSLVFTRYNG